MDGRDIRQFPFPELPELEVVGNTEIQKPLPPLDIPFIDGCINIYFGYKGSKQMQAQGEIFHLNGGEYFATPAGVTHSTGPMPISKCAHYWLRLNLGLKSVFLNDPAYEEIRKRLQQLPIVHGKFSEVCFQALRNIYDLAAQTDSQLRNLEIRLQLGLFLLKFIEQVDAQEVPPQTPALDTVLEYLLRHIGENLSVQDMANVIGVSASTLQALFIKHTGMAPAEYFTRKKMDAAKHMLIEGSDSVRSISEQLGYTNERYFSTAFRRYYLEPPGRFRLKFSKK